MEVIQHIFIFFKNIVKKIIIKNQENFFFLRKKWRYKKNCEILDNKMGAIFYEKKIVKEIYLKKWTQIEKNGGKCLENKIEQIF